MRAEIRHDKIPSDRMSRLGGIVPEVEKRPGNPQALCYDLPVQGELPLGLGARERRQSTAVGAEARWASSREPAQSATDPKPTAPTECACEQHVDVGQLLLKPEQVAKALAIGRTRVYELMASGSLPSILIGRSRRVPRQAVVRFVEDLCSRDPQE
ncbi:MAG: helix-turn-helix domain-containing protein [Acidimicrobiales bacterium]|jgi:excisionase family DNA binding protein